MGYERKAEKWATAVGLPREPYFWLSADSAPLKEFFAKLLSAEIVKTAADVILSDAIPFEKILSIAQFKLGIHTCLVGSDLIESNANLKLGLFGTLFYLKSALADYKPELIYQLSSPEFSIAGGDYSAKPNCQKCGKFVLFIERIFVAEKVYHRSCLHCNLCGKRLFLGMFRIVNNNLICFKHFLDHSLSGNELTPFENVKPVKAPPPRPPPPISVSVQKPLSDEINADSNANTDAISPKPDINTKGSDHSSDSNWEMVYPEKLNPFADDDELESVSDLNPFGDTSSDSDSDVEHISTTPSPKPLPRTIFSQKSPVVKESPKETVAETPKEVTPKAELVQIPMLMHHFRVLNKSAVSVEAIPETPKTILTSEYPNLKKLLVDLESESAFSFYLPSSLALCKKRKVDLSEYDCPKLLHELDDTMKRLDYIERTTKEIERTLLKELAKETFNWEKSAEVDAWGKAMAQRHDFLLKGSMIVHEYLKKLLIAALDRIERTGNSSHLALKGHLLDMQAKLNLKVGAVSLPEVMENPPEKPKKEGTKGKKLVKKIKKVF